MHCWRDQVHVLAKLGLVLVLACGPRGVKTIHQAPDSTRQSEAVSAEMPLAGAKVDSSAHVASSPETTIVVTITRVNLEGGFWGLVDDAGNRYDPTGSLKEELQKEGTRVRVTGRLQDNIVTSRMWGTAIKITSYELLDTSAKRSVRPGN
ncbi:MAG: hypothetical protein ABIK62_01920 [candidate division WOR-3 bacterium]